MKTFCRKPTGLWASVPHPGSHSAVGAAAFPGHQNTAGCTDFSGCPDTVVPGLWSAVHCQSRYGLSAQQGLSGCSLCLRCCRSAYTAACFPASCRRYRCETVIFSQTFKQAYSGETGAEAPENCAGHNRPCFPRCLFPSRTPGS